MPRTLEFLGAMRPAFVAHLAERLSESICASSQALADAAGLKAPARTHSVLLFLLANGPSSLIEMARSDGQSHQLLASRLKPLEKAGLIRRFADANDGRRFPYQLTRTGLAEARMVQANIAEHARAMEGLFAETGVDLVQVLDDVLEALRVKSLRSRVEAMASARTNVTAPKRQRRVGVAP